MRGYGFNASYGVDRFPEIPDPKTVYIFERGSFVKTNSKAVYGARETTLRELKKLYGELIDKKKFK